MNSKTLKIFGTLAILLICLSILINCSKQTSPIDPVGIYLETLGNGYVVIDRNPQGKLYIKDANIVFTSKWEVSFIRKKLKISSSKDSYNRSYIYELLPSSMLPGDWDLVNIKIEASKQGQTGFNLWSVPTQLYQLFSQPINPAPQFVTLKQTIPSFLHRVDDMRLVNFFKLLPDPYKKVDFKTNNSALIKLALELQTLHPDDKYMKLLYLDVLIRDGDIEKLKKEKEEWEADYSKSGDGISKYALACAEESLRSIELSNSGQNAYDFIENVFKNDVDLKKRLELFSRVSQCEDYVARKTFLFPHYQSNFLEMQVSSKVFCVEADFLILQGKREEALNLIASVYQFGNILNESNMLISRLIGIAIRMIATNKLGMYASNCCEKQEDFENFWNMLEHLNRDLQKPEIWNLTLMENSLDYYLEYNYKPNITEMLTRYYVADAHFQLVRMATAAKYHFITQGTFPQNPNELAPLLPTGLPKDSFSSESLKFISNPDEFTCYSIGPDKQDNFANIIYDSTNGTVSSGDIILKVPSQREYPFPKNGVRASTRDELLKQFPNNLPYDSFSIINNTRLRITNSVPIYIFSIGPDINENEIQKTGDSYIPKVHYDPTNGTTSAGDLFIAIPE